jgi:NAD(P)-dependent dehydrogenase (short-subunit alcohol dehydrogenase family)
MADEYLKRGWHVVATERKGARSKLHDLLPTIGERLEIETVDITDPDQVMALRGRLAERTFDLLFVNAGVKNDDRETMPMIRARCCSWPPAGFARTWVVPRRVLALTRAFQTWSRPSKHRQARADCNTSIISVGRFPGE